jgi:hypothetical protein
MIVTFQQGLATGGTFTNASAKLTWRITAVKGWVQRSAPCFCGNIHPWPMSRS